jgi:hypothetical protein
VIIGNVSRRKREKQIAAPTTDRGILEKAPEKELVEAKQKKEEDPFAPSKTVAQALLNTEKSFWGRITGVF